MTNLLMAGGQGSAGGSMRQLVGFGIGNEEYCVDILKVQEIIRMTDITTMPNSPDYLEGVINLRGGVIPVVDFRSRFHMGDGEGVEDRQKRIVVMSLEAMTVGLIVDRVTHVFKLPAEQISPPPVGSQCADADAVVGIGRQGGKLMLVLDLEQVFGAEVKAATEACSLPLAI